MKTVTLQVAFTFLSLLFFYTPGQAQAFGIKASAVWLSDCNQNDFFNTSGNPLNLIGPSGNSFNNANLGVHTQNSGSLIFRGGELRTFKLPAVANVCAARLHYRIYAQSGVPGAFSVIDLPFVEDCAMPAGQYPSGGNCVAGDQKWNRIIADGSTTPYAPVNLTAFTPGNYVLELYYDISGSSTSTSLCDETVVLNNSGNNYKAFFSIQSPSLASTNPTTCNGNQGSIVISGLVAGTVYSVAYLDDGAAVGPTNYTANASGQIIIGGLNAGIYSNFDLLVNGCITELNTGVILSNPVVTPTFSPIPPFCAGTTPPILPTTSNNGISGTWSPSVVSNTASGTYTFTPAAGQCGLPVTRNITVTPRTVPSFSFGTSRTICAGGSVPVLPNTSSNGINGTWSPAVVNNTTSGTYTFTPNTGICASPTTFTLTVNPNITPSFPFGTVLTICAGGAVPALPATSDNGITGTWSPAVVDNQASGTYTFTPSAGQCATTRTFTVTVNPNTTPVFSFGNSLTICAGDAVPVLPTTSSNGVAGTWSPAVVSNTSSGTYTFTPNAGLCAFPFTFTVSVTAKVVPSFSFGTAQTICAGGAVPTLPNTSDNGINGSWSPAVVNNSSSGTYTFTPAAGVCATSTSFTLTVSPNIAPSFSFGTTLTICAGGTVPALPATSQNGISGTWSPAVVDNNASGVYTFTPTAGVCATSTSFSVTVNPIVTPNFSFGTTLSICAGAGVPTLPGSSTNGVTGSWSPAVVNNQASGTYTFTPGAGQCASSTTFTVTVTANATPTFAFGTSLTICAGGTVPTLPSLSDNGINGSWSPAVVNNNASGVYTFTPAAGVCANSTSFTVTVNPIVTPVFSFGTAQTICAGSTAPVLPNTSTNGITGSWSPAVVDNQASGTYTFTPAAGQCANSTTFTVTVTANTTPTFSFGNALTICAGGSVPTLPSVSNNGVNGNWSPAVINNNASGVYTFTPTAGGCAISVTFTVTVNPNTVPTFSFGSALSICQSGTVPVLPATSNNGITGTWSPAVVDNQASGTYTFTPAAGVCATGASFTVTVNPNVTPVFSFGTALTICSSSTPPLLPTTSDNGITGTWNPAVVNNQNNGVYTFTPTAGLCAGTTSLTVTVTPTVLPVFSFGSSLTICAGGNVPLLPTTSDNGIPGTWSPAIVDNQNSAVYIFTPSTPAAQCVQEVQFNVTVNAIKTPQFSFGTTQTLCADSTAPILPATSVNGVTGSWSPATVSNQTSGTYTFNTAPGQCAVGSATLTVTVNPTPSISSVRDTIVNDGAILPVHQFTGTPSGLVFNWTNNNTATGLAASGQGSVPSFTAVNKGSADISSLVTVTPVLNGCAGSAVSYRITVRPLEKDVFVPNVFTPNGDGKNDVLYVYGNYIKQVELRIFNQWGELVETITNQANGWNGTQRGKPQPVGVYVYELKAQLTDGRSVRLKGYIHLLR